MSLRTLLMTRFAVIMALMVLGMALIFYLVIGPAVMGEVQGYIRDALGQAGVDEAQINTIMDGSQERYFSGIRASIRRNVLGATAVFFLVGLGFTYVVTSQATRAIRALTEAARAIARGEYKQDLSHIYNMRPRVEINELAEAIEESGRVHIREMVLIEKVKELEIKIDESKRQEQLDELTGSEFFQDLQSKAKRIRQAKAESEADEAGSA